MLRRLYGVLYDAMNAGIPQAKLSRNRRHGLAGVRQSADFSQSPVNGARPPDGFSGFRSVALPVSDPAERPLPDQVAFEFRNAGKDCAQQLALRCAQVEPTLQADEGDS